MIKIDGTQSRSGQLPAFKKEWLYIRMHSNTGCRIKIRVAFKQQGIRTTAVKTSTGFYQKDVDFQNLTLGQGNNQEKQAELGHIVTRILNDEKYL